MKTRPPRPNKKKVIILGSGPNRIGRELNSITAAGHASFALRDDGYETIMINCNPETVSTDYDTSDRFVLRAAKRLKTWWQSISTRLPKAHPSA